MEYIGAYWGALYESKENISGDLSKLFKALEIIEPSLYGKWFLRSNNKSTAKQYQVNTTITESIQGILRKYSETDTGFSGGLWNGAENNAEAFSIDWVLGSKSEYVGNNVVLSFPYSESFSQKYDINSLVNKIKEIIIDIFDPEVIKIDGMEIYKNTK